MTDLLTATMARVVRADIQGLHAYAVQPSAGMVKVELTRHLHAFFPVTPVAIPRRAARAQKAGRGERI